MEGMWSVLPCALQALRAFCISAVSSLPPDVPKLVRFNDNGAVARSDEPTIMNSPPSRISVIIYLQYFTNITLINSHFLLLLFHHLHYFCGYYRDPTAQRASTIRCKGVPPSSGNRHAAHY